MPEKDPKILTVGELNKLAQNLLEEKFSNIWVEGEVSNFRGVASSGHCYFSIKDETAQVDVVAFKGVMGQVRFKLEDGLKILVSGRVSLYLQRGKSQVIASAIEPRGMGALQLAFEQLKKKLEAEGLFDPARKRPIPGFPQKIGIVTSPTGAAIKDMLNVIGRRFASVEILIYPCKVQGEGSKDEIAAGIHYLNDNHPDLDVLLIGRGGGSIEDLWAFNEEVVARAIAGSKIPTISCVGHEIDFTIADFVADLRAPTPSAAAELVVKNKAELQDSLEHTFARLRQNVLAKLEFALEQLKGIARSAAFSRPQEFFEEQAQNLDDLFEQARRAFEQLLERRVNQLALLSSKIGLLSPETVLNEKLRFLDVQAEKLNAQISHKLEQWRDALRGRAGQLEALSPLAVLNRGYAIAFSLPDNKVLKSALQVQRNDAIRVKLHQGEIRATVQQTTIGEQTHDQEGSHQHGIEKR